MRVHPAARRDEIGGRYGTEEPPVLNVRVTAPAADGRANAALVSVVAEAFGVRRSAVSVVAGARGRTKVLEVAGADSEVLDRLLAR